MVEYMAVGGGAHRTQLGWVLWVLCGTEGVPVQ